MIKMIKCKRDVAERADWLISNNDEKLTMNEEQCQNIEQIIVITGKNEIH